MTKIAEAVIERRFKKLLPRSAMYIKFQDPGRVGAPDRLILLPGGQAIFIEWKRPGESPRQTQLDYAADLTALGFNVAWFTNTEDAIEWLNSFRISNEQKRF